MAQDRLSSMRDETSALPEVLSSILGVKDTLAGDNAQEPSGQSAGTVHDMMDNDDTELEPSFVEAAVADFNRSIEAWAEKAMNTHAGPEDQRASPGRYSEQCYGMIHGCEARLIGNMQDLRTRLASMSSVENWAPFQVCFMSNICFLGFEDAPRCGQLRDGLYHPLHQICDKHAVRLVAYVLISECFRVMERARRKQEAAIKVVSTFMAPRVSAEKLVGSCRRRSYIFSIRNVVVLGLNTRTRTCFIIRISIRTAHLKSRKDHHYRLTIPKRSSEWFLRSAIMKPGMKMSATTHRM